MTEGRIKKKRSPFLFLLFLLGGGGAVFMAASFAQEIHRRIVLQRHIEDLKVEIRTREQKIADLKNLTHYLETDAYLERAAREKLNYQRSGEKVVVVPERERVLGAEDTRESASKEKLSVPRQWWELIFP